MQWQLQVTAAEAWAREFREKVAALLVSHELLSALTEKQQPLETTDAELRRTESIAFRRNYHAIMLLSAERGRLYQRPMIYGALQRLFSTMSEAAATDFAEMAKEILAEQREAISADPGVWRELRARLGLRAVRRRRPWSPAGSGTMRGILRGKLRTWIALDPAHKARFETQWGLTDRIFKMVQWALTIAVVAALAQRAKGTPHQSVLILLGMVLLLAWASPFWFLLSAYFQSRFPDIDQRSRIYGLVVTLACVALGLAIIFAAFQAFEVLVNAQINQILK